MERNKSRPPAGCGNKKLLINGGSMSVQDDKSVLESDNGNDWIIS